MDSLTTASLLGLVEGLTEFIPVSSSGHLIIAGHLLDFLGPKADTFEVVIQVGAILAVVLLYGKRFFSLLRPDSNAAFSGIRGLSLLLLTTFPAAFLGLCLHDFIKSLFTPLSVAAALVAGAVLMLAVERHVSRSWAVPSSRDLDHITALQALGIGCFQCLALWPGFSRSASTIMGGMILGVQRKTAAEYSFIAAVPIIAGAAGYDLLRSLPLLTADDLTFFLAGSAAAFVSAVIAIRFFIKILGKYTLKAFAIYRLLLAIPVYLFLAG
ncbi:undecaprenyl-diphosphate phosphatase [uncultured Mailhella sp.]|uniref:undecaprenyl-diphosphate phosphatase n=1 Tax=uncultured Mailhella sp. TaxID=1981031 RepID=UPI00261EAAAC|nr:undecaprenyl-diphosphate phosphatase [uncultured Mailhella sp.]